MSKGMRALINLKIMMNNGLRDLIFVKKYDEKLKIKFQEFIREEIYLQIWLLSNAVNK